MNYINSKKFFVVILLFSFALSCAQSCGAAAKEDISSAVFRLHVVANSDSKADQSLKLEVRNRIISEASALFSAAKTAGEAEKLAQANLSFLKEICEDEISKQGSCQSVRIETGEYYFPQKSYGGITLPCGRYRALKVIIGEGKGKNWWCVMFPPLCFAKGTVKLSKNSEGYLKTALTPEEFNLISSGKSADTPEIRFKLAEVIAKLKSRL